MTTMVAELYDALREAGASEDKARKAAETAAANENRFSKLETELTVIKWMLGVNIAICIILLMMALRH